MFGTLGGPELLLILVIALIVFGPRKLPEMGRSLGKMMLEFRRASNEFRRTVEDEVDAEQARDRAATLASGAAPSAAGTPSATPPEPPPASEPETEAAAAEPVLAPPAGTVAVGQPAPDAPDAESRS